MENSDKRALFKMVYSFDNFMSHVVKKKEKVMNIF